MELPSWACWSCQPRSRGELRQPHSQKGLALDCFISSTEGKWGSSSAPRGQLPSPCARCLLLCCLPWEPTGPQNSWPLGCRPRYHLSWRKKHYPGQSRVGTTELGTAGGWVSPKLPVSRHTSVGLPPALGDDVLGLGTHVPLHPGAVVDGYIWLAAEVGPQDHMAGCDAGAARGHQGQGQVHLLVLKEAADLLRALLQAVLSQEVREGDVDSARDVAGLDACNRRAEGREQTFVQGW